jgi:hypothetical protein
MRGSRSILLAVSTLALVASALAVPSIASAAVPLDVAGSLNPSAVSFPATAEGATSAAIPVTLTNNGTDALVVSGPAIISGVDPDSFSISADTCNGVSLATGATCSVSVKTTPQAVGQITGSLVIPDNSTAGNETAALSVNATDVTHGLYYKVPSTRILDTRIGLGASKHPVKGGGTIAVQILSKGHVPMSGASAVVLNVTVVNPTAGGYITAWPSGTARPTVSSLNFSKGWVGANLITVPIGSNGKVDLFNSSGNTDLLADVQGWYASSDHVASASHGVGGSYFPQQTPVRILDTRVDGGVHDPLPGGFQTEVAVEYDGEIAASQIHALAITLTATQVHHGGYLTATDIGSDPTVTSTLNMTPGVNTPNLAIVSTEPCTESWCLDPGNTVVVFKVYNGSSANADVVADLQGTYFDDTISPLRFHTLTPTRIVDSRIPLGATGPLGEAATQTIVAPPSVNSYNTVALSANFTAVNPSASTYLVVWPNFTGGSKPGVSNLDPSAGAVVATGALIGFGDDQSCNVYNNAGTTNFVVDVSGAFDVFPPQTPPPAAPARAAPADRSAQSSPAYRATAALGHATKGATGPTRAWAHR